jgi:uncharacterized membrane protein
MEERRKHRDRRAPADAAQAWITLPPIVRIVCAIAIIAGIGWLLLQVMQLVTMLAFVLAR